MQVPNVVGAGDVIGIAGRCRDVPVEALAQMRDREPAIRLARGTAAHRARASAVRSAGRRPLRRRSSPCRRSQPSAPRCFPGCTAGSAASKDCHALASNAAKSADSLDLTFDSLWPGLCSSRNERVRAGILTLKKRTSFAMSSPTQQEINGNPAALTFDRAVDELRRGRAVQVTDGCARSRRCGDRNAAGAAVRAARRRGQRPGRHARHRGTCACRGVVAPIERRRCRGFSAGDGSRVLAHARRRRRHRAGRRRSSSTSIRRRETHRSPRLRSNSRKPAGSYRR